MTAIAILATINSLIVAAVVLYVLHKNSELELMRFREFTKAIKAKDLSEYVEVIPEANEDAVEEPMDELVDLDSVDEDSLAQILRKEYEN